MIHSFKTRCLSVVVMLMLSLCAWSQSESSDTMAIRRWIKHLDLGVTLGTGGIGVEASVPVTSWAKVRAGIGYMPRFNVPMTFGLSSYVANEGLSPIDTKIEKMQEILSRFTGLTIDEEIKMNAHARMFDFRLMVDFYPFKNNRHWYGTVGFYWGTSKIGHIENTIHEMPSLVGVMMYNTLYDFFVNERYWDEPLFDGYLIDIELGDKLRDKLLGIGKVGAHLGDFKDTGKPYLMVPGEDGLLQADMYVNSFKPYVGFGYETTFCADKRWKLGFDAGVLFWGGVPRVRTHNNVNYADLDHNWKGDDHSVDLTHDVTGVKGKAGRYLDVTKALTVFPIINAKISFTIF